MCLNIKERGDLEQKKIMEQFPELGAKSFKDRAERITEGIKYDIEEEKKQLKTQIEAVDKQLIGGTITKEQAEDQKLQLAEKTANSIESKVADRQKTMSLLAQEEIAGKLPKDVKGGSRIKIEGFDIAEYYDLSFDGEESNVCQIDEDCQETGRTPFQIVYAVGINNLVTNRALANSDFGNWNSRFYEWGMTFNTRIQSNHNLLHAKYGLSLMYNDLKPTDNRYFVVNGNQTDLVKNPIHQDDSRFRNVNLVIPLHLEFDFTKPTIKNDKTYFETHHSFRFGIGGFIGANIKSKQILKFDKDGYETVEKTKGDFNANGFVYGVSTYFGYGAASLYLKYDLNPIFKNSTVDQNNISMGLRFDFN